MAMIIILPSAKRDDWTVFSRRTEKNPNGPFYTFSGPVVVSAFSTVYAIFGKSNSVRDHPNTTTRNDRHGRQVINML